tara:strand:- start:7760 stop:8215 length:456 start_codon:yes stop_codon:yes gene_type:complete
MRRKIWFKSVLLIAVMYSIVGWAQESSDPNLRVEIVGLSKLSGYVFVSVYDSESTWLGSERVVQRKVNIQEALQGEVVVLELALASGEYALSVFYDVNGNGKLDSNFMKIPKEPIALSNNTKPSFGPPKYEDAAFVTSDTLIVQRLVMEVD